MRALLAFALLAPVAALFPVATTPPPDPVRRWLEGGTLVAAAAWLAIVVDGDRALALGRLRPSPVAAAATCGACLLVAAVRRPAARGAVYAGGLAVGGIGLGLAADSLLLLLAGLTTAVVALAAAAWSTEPGAVVPVALGMLGVAGVTVAVAGIHAASDGWSVPTEPVADAGGLTVLAALAGAAALVVAGGMRPRRTTAVLLPAGLAVGLVLLPFVADPVDGTRGVAVVLALLAAATAGPGLPHRSLRPLPPAVPVGLFALAVLAVAPAPHLPAAALLGAGAVVVALLAAPAGIVAALPGAVAAAIALADTGGTVPLLVAVLGLVAAVSLADDARAAVRARPMPAGLVSAPPVAGVLGAAVAAWLVITPRTWTWVGDTGLDHYSEGAAAAAAAGLITVLAVAGLRRAVPNLPVRAVLAGETPDASEVEWRAAALAAGVSALGISLVALVASAAVGG